MSTLLTEHHALEGVGRLGELLVAAEKVLDTVQVHLGNPMPRSLGNREAMMAVGGPIGVHETDRYPHLDAELRLIEEAIRAKVAVLGICLGSQLLAAALGARVRPGLRKELGWYRVV